MKSKDISESAPQEQTKSRLRENIEAVLVAVVLALFIRTFVIQAFKIPSGSMKPTLEIGDHIMVNKFIYGVKIPYWGNTLIPIKKPKHGDIIVFKFPEDPDKDFIKRVVGVGGDRVEIRDRQIYINNRPFDDRYGVYTDPFTAPDGTQAMDNFGPVTVPPDSLFVMGDNRDHSYDSRFWGFVTLRAVKGKAFIIYWSWDKDRFGWSLDKVRFSVRWDRIGKILK